MKKQKSLLWLYAVISFVVIDRMNPPEDLQVQLSALELLTITRCDQEKIAPPEWDALSDSKIQLTHCNKFPKKKIAPPPKFT